MPVRLRFLIKCERINLLFGKAAMRCRLSGLCGRHTRTSGPRVTRLCVDESLRQRHHVGLYWRICMVATPRIEVPKVASPQQVRSFVDDGFLVMPDLVSPAEIEELKADTAHLARG